MDSAETLGDIEEDTGRELNKMLEKAKQQSSCEQIMLCNKDWNHGWSRRTMYVYTFVSTNSRL